jgi:hypothetical protein
MRLRSRIRRVIELRGASRTYVTDQGSVVTETDAVVDVDLTIPPQQFSPFSASRRKFCSRAAIPSRMIAWQSAVDSGRRRYLWRPRA